MVVEDGDGGVDVVDAVGIQRDESLERADPVGPGLAAVEHAWLQDLIARGAAVLVSDIVVVGEDPGRSEPSTRTNAPSVPAVMS